MKGVAELSSKLLARKGEAAPATRAAADSRVNEPTFRRRAPQSFGKRQIDGGETEPRRGEGTTPPQGASELPDNVPQKAEGRRVAFTLRLDPERHKMFRLLCAQTGRSGQSLLIEALDTALAAYLEGQTNCTCLKTAYNQEGGGSGGAKEG